MYSQLLSIAITEWVDDSDSQSENKLARKSPSEPKETKIRLSAHSGYRANFEACFMSIGCLEKHNFSTALLENSRNHDGMGWFSVNSHKAPPLGPVSGLAVIVPLQNWLLLQVTEYL